MLASPFKRMQEASASLAMTQILYLLFGTLLLLGSGLGILWLVPPLRRALTALEAIPCALLGSSGVCAAWALLGRVAGMRIGPWSVVLLLLSCALPLAGLLVMIRRRRRDRGAAEREPRALRLFLLALAGFAFVLMCREGGSLGPVHDSLDFVAFVNETLQTGDLAPDSPIYRNAGTEVPPDPRRGSFHTQIAALCWLTGTQPTDAWRWLPRLLVPIAVLGLGAMFRAWLGVRAAGLGTLLFVATTFFSIDRFIQNIGYASRFGWVCGWGALLCLVQGINLRARGHPREGNALLVAAAAGPTILTSVHLLSGLQCMLALGCAALAIGTDRTSKPVDRRVAFIAIAGAALLLLPSVLFKLGQSSTVRNAVFDHIYGVLLIAPGWPVLLPSYILDRFGVAGIAGSVLGLGLLPAVRRSRAAGFLAWSTLIPLCILFFPPIVRIVVGAHAHSMLFRVILTIPFAGTLAWCALEGLKRLAAGGAARRLGAGAVLLIVLLGLAGQAMTTRSAWRVPQGRRAEYSESEAIVHAYRFLNERFREVQTVLSDPLTSYSIPAYTRHDAVAPLHQHSSPSDPTVVDRIRDVQEALNGRVGLERTFRVLRKYNVDLILLNQSFKRYSSSYYTFISPLAFPEQRAKFDGAPQFFERIYDAEGISIYRVHDPGAPVPLPGDPPNPDRIPDPGLPPILASGHLELLRLDIRPGTHVPGQPFAIDMIWRRRDASGDLPVVCDVKVQLHGLPRSYGIPVIGRLRSLSDEHRSHKIRRFGRSFRPLMTFYPDFLWTPGETYRDTFWLPIPAHLEEGTYDLWIRLGTEPFAPVRTLSEVLSDRLEKDWRPVGEMVIGVPGTPLPSQQDQKP